MKTWQIVALTFGILGWSTIAFSLIVLMRVANSQTDFDDWQEEFCEENVPISDTTLDKYL